MKMNVAVNGSTVLKPVLLGDDVPLPDDETRGYKLATTDVSKDLTMDPLVNKDSSMGCDESVDEGLASDQTSDGMEVVGAV